MASNACEIISICYEKMVKLHCEKCAPLLSRADRVLGPEFLSASGDL